MRIATRAVGAVAIVVALGIFAGSAAAAAPQNTAAPTISGTAKEGSTLTAQEGTWSNTPTSFAYQWQRCASDGTGCGDINGAASKTYVPVTSDVGHTLRVVVTATNADGKASATSDSTDVIGAKNGPTNTVKPALSGTATVGESLRVANGSWSPTPTSFGHQWQRCASDGTGCLNIGGATGQTYGVRSADVGHRIRALVTARTSNGNTTVASGTSDTVASSTSTVTTTTTTTVPSNGNKAPSIAVLSLHRHGAKAYVRYRVCDDHNGRITVIERDNKNRVLSVTRRWHVSLRASCVVFAKHWVLRHAFRTHGRYVATLRAMDAQGRLSLVRSRALLFR